MPSFLGSLYTGLTIFGGGVLLIDLMGLLGGGDDTEGGDDGGADMDGDAADGSADDADGGAEDANGDEGAEGRVVGDTSGVLILSFLRHLRSTVYFSVGCGPTGLVAMWKGHGTVGSLVWAVPTGCVSLIVVRGIMRLITKDTDSTLRTEDILMTKATVLIPVSKGNMGKVRIVTGQFTSEQYALPEHEEESFEAGDTVYVTNVTDECVYIESELRFEQGASQKLADL